MDVILIPGLWLDADSWGQVTPALAATNHAVTVVPLPGLGGSGAETAETGMADWVDAVVAAVDAADRPVVLVGHSGGGNAAWGAAAARPDRVARVVFVDTVPPPPGAGIGDFPVVDGVIPFPGWDFFDDEMIDDLDDQARAAWGPRTASIPARTATDGIALASEDRFGIPVTLLMGPFDGPELRETITQWGPFADEFAAIRDATVVPLRSGHWPQFSQPAAFTEAVLRAVGA